MVALTKFIFFIFLFYIPMTEGEQKKSVDKIIIHVPYKIHKHHHTHTKYKVITLPSPKKENTIIYLKEDVQPMTKQVSPVQIQTQVIPVQTKTQQPFIPPHQESATAFLESLAKHKEQNSEQVDDQQKYNAISSDQQQYSTISEDQQQFSTISSDQQQYDTISEGQQQYSTIIHDQKPLESHAEQTTKDLAPKFAYPQILLPPQNFIPNFSFKPVILPQQQAFMPKFLLNPEIHHSYEGFFPKFEYQHMQHLPQAHFTPKFMFKPIYPPKKITLDNVAQTSNHFYKTVLDPNQKPKAYKVKEENQEGRMHLTNHQEAISNTVPVPSVSFNRKGKMFLHPGHHQLKNLGNMIPSNPNYEFEHVGYLIIDGKSRKVVGKNFKDQIHLSR